MPTLLAVDAGVRCGLAWYGGDGRLRRYHAQNFGDRRRLRRAIPNLLRGVDQLYVEGGGTCADPWFRAAERFDIPWRGVGAEAWRATMLLQREQRSGAVAKRNADTHARAIITWSGAPKPRGALRHDAAEAIVFGLWAVLELGWIEAAPV